MNETEQFNALESLLNNKLGTDADIFTEDHKKSLVEHGYWTERVLSVAGVDTLVKYCKLPAGYAELLRALFSKGATDTGAAAGPAVAGATGTGAAAGPAASARQESPLPVSPGDLPENMYARVFRVMHVRPESSSEPTPQCVGSACLIEKGGLLMARHIFVVEEDVKPGTTTIDLSCYYACNKAAKNGLKFSHLASFPAHDITICQLNSERDMPGFELARVGTEQLMIGQKAVLLGYPFARDVDCPEFQTHDDLPQASHGHIASLSKTGNVGLASYESLPNDSGGAVVISTRTLAGVHTESMWHLDTTSGNAMDEVLPVPDVMELDEWQVSSGVGHGKSRRDTDATTTSQAGERPVKAAKGTDRIADVERKAQHCINNIPHKGSFGRFVPSFTLEQLIARYGAECQRRKLQQTR